MSAQQATGKVKVTPQQALGLLGPYARSRFMEQVKSVWLIILYLIFFQTLILGLPIADASVIAAGLAIVILGLTFFMEGLLLGLMPLGEVCGVKLPQKSKLPVIIVFSFILGMGATFAEPAIGVLKAAGASVKAWDAPLLFLLLNTYPNYLVYAVGVGVGIAVIFGMMRFLYNWSLKPFIYTLVGGVTLFSVWGYFNPNVRFLTGLAWDCGAVTTGPVTVPLVLALGIGICRVVGSASSGSAGFGVVTLASLFPILSVLSLGVVFLGQVPPPMGQQAFFSPENRERAMALFAGEDEMIGYALLNAGEPSQKALFDGSAEKMASFLRGLTADAARRRRVFGPEAEAMEKWAALKGSEAQRLAVFGSPPDVQEAVGRYAAQGTAELNTADLIRRNGRAAVQAILPLTIFLVLVLLLVLREKLPRADEVVLGIGFALFGMGLFNVGIEIGLAKLGAQVGGKVPSSFKEIELEEETRILLGFDPAVVQEALLPDGTRQPFFYTKVATEYVAIPYEAGAYDPATGQYTYTPTRGPLFGGGGFAGILVVLLFAFFMGYGATLAEPALNALGLTVEELTVGAFKKALLMQAVALGVGAGIALGVAKIIWDIPLIWMLAPPYLLLMFITKISTEEFVNIGWDSAGVTTGPVTVPLVLAMGLGIGTQVGVVEGFGILAMASVCPILSVLLVGLNVTRKRRVALMESEAGEKSAAVVKG